MISPAPRLFFEDFVPGAVYALGTCALSAEEIVAFARAYDPQPFHVDADAARQSMFGGLIASGWHTASSYMRLFVDHLLNGSTSQGSPGLDELRWPTPVRPGDILSATYTVLEVRPSGSRPTLGIVRGRGEMVNQRGEVVLHMLSAGFFGRRSGAAISTD